MEQTPFTESVEDSSKKKKKTKIARNLPLGGAVDAEKTQPEPARTTLAERLALERERRTQKVNEGQPIRLPEKEETKKETVEETEPESTAPTPEDTEHHEPAEADHKKIEKAENPEPVLEAADWEPEEGELIDAGEISLNTREPAEAVSFAELPIDTIETNEELAVVDPELLAEGLEPEDDGEETAVEPMLDVAAESTPQEVFEDAAPNLQQPWYDAVAADKIAQKHKEELEETARTSEKRGLSRGVTSGLFVGWLFGRRGKKKAEKEHREAMEVKQAEVQTAEKKAAEARLEAVKRTEEAAVAAFKTHELEAARYNEEAKKKRIAAEVTNEAVLVPEKAVPEEKYEAAVEEIVEQTANRVESSQPAGVSSFEAPVAAEILAQAPSEHVQEKSSSKEAPRAAMQIPGVQSAQKTDEKAPENVEITEDTYTTQEGTRVETSAWHRIEVDAKTGKPIENPEVAYGEEFKREQAREVLREDPKTAQGGSAGPAAFLGGLAAAALTSEDEGTKQEQNLSSPYENQESSSLMVEKDHHAHLSAGNGLLHYASKPLTWALAGVIVLILFILGVLK